MNKIRTCTLHPSSTVCTCTVFSTPFLLPSIYFFTLFPVYSFICLFLPSSPLLFLSLPPFLPPSFTPFLPPFSFFPSFLPSLPPSFPSSLLPSLPPSLPPFLTPTFFPFLSPSLLPLFSLPPSLPQFKPEMVDLVYDCAKFRYECGNYSEAAEYLYFYRVLVSNCVEDICLQLVKGNISI